MQQFHESCRNHGGREGRCGEEGGWGGGGRGIRMNHGAFPWGEFHFVTAQSEVTGGLTGCVADG